MFAKQFSFISKVTYTLYVLLRSRNNSQAFTNTTQQINWKLSEETTSRTKTVTITVQTLPSIFTLWRLTFSSSWCMQSAGWTKSPSGVPQKSKESFTSCKQRNQSSIHDQFSSSPAITKEQLQRYNNQPYRRMNNTQPNSYIAQENRR